MKIKLKKNSKIATKKGDFYFAGGNLILNCPFCGKRSYFGPMNVSGLNGKFTITGLDDWIKCCKYFKIILNKVIEMK